MRFLIYIQLRDYGSLMISAKKQKNKYHFIHIEYQL